MTKLKFRNNDKLAHKKEKRNFYYEDYDEYEHYVRSKIRVPSRNQYKRLKNELKIQNYFPRENSFKRYSRNYVSPTSGSQSSTNCSTESKPNSESDFGAPRTSFSYVIQPDWSEFEDSDHLNFISQDVDVTHILETFDDSHDSGLHIYDDISFSFDNMETSLCKWAVELSHSRYEDTVGRLTSVHTFLQNNYESLFELDDLRDIWNENLIEMNNVMVSCESNKRLLEDLAMKEEEQSVAFQHQILQWSELFNKCSSTKVCFEAIRNLYPIKLNGYETLRILFEQCLSLTERGLFYPDPLVKRVLQGINRISFLVREEMGKVQSVLCNIFGDHKKFYPNALDTLDESIQRLKESQDNFNVENTLNLLECVGKLLNTDVNLNSVQKRVFFIFDNKTKV